MKSRSALKWRHDTQHNDIPHNDIPYNDIPHNDIQHNDTQHNDTRCTVMLSVVYTESRKYAHYAVPEYSA
jgi:hypothetical protein